MASTVGAELTLAAVRRTRISRLLIGGISAAVLAWLVIVFTVERVQFVILEPAAKTGIEVFLALVDLFAALVLVLFPVRAARPRLRWVAAGLAVLGIGGLVLGYAYPSAAHEVDLNAELYGWLFVRSLATGLFVVGLVPRTAPSLTKFGLLVGLTASTAVGLVVLTEVDRLPTLVRPGDLLAVAADDSIVLDGLTAWHWALSAVPLGLALIAAAGAVRTYPGHVVGWLAVAMVLLSGSQLHAAFWPSAYGPFVTSSSVLRVAFTASVAVGSFFELRHVAAERAAALAAEREYARRLAELVRLRDAFAFEAADRFRTALAGLERAAGVAERGPLAPDQTRAIGDVHDAANAVANLIAAMQTGDAQAVATAAPLRRRPRRTRRRKPAPPRRRSGRARPAVARRSRRARSATQAMAAPARRLLLVDDHATAREPLAALLRQEPGLIVVQAGSAEEARRVLAEAPADLAVVDLDLPDGDGVVLIAEILVAAPGSAVLGLAERADRSRIARAVEAGAAGVVQKASPVRDLVAAVRRMRIGEPILAPSEAIELLRLASEERARAQGAERLVARLTPREREVLQALALGLSDKEIAERLHVSPKTVRFHMANVLAKLGVDSRLQALVVAMRHGIVEIG